YRFSCSTWQRARRLDDALRSATDRTSSRHAGGGVGRADPPDRTSSYSAARRTHQQCGRQKAALSTLDARRGRTYRDWTICKWMGPGEPLERIPPATAYATRNTSTESRRPRSVIGGRGSAWIPA